MKTAISHRLSTRIIALAMMLMLTGVAALALSAPAKADGDPLPNYSFYKLSSSLAAFFSNAQSPDPDAVPIKTEVWNSVLNDPGSAGSMLGYVDSDLSPDLGFLMSAMSGSSSSFGYDTLVQSTRESGDGATSKTPGLLDYAHFGATLNGMGLDSMGTGLSLGFVAPLAGGLIMILYICTGAVDVLFSAVIGTLKILNPFKLFYAGVNVINPTFAEGMTGGTTAPGFLGGLSSWIGSWYVVLNSLSWAVIVPLFLGVVLLGLVLSKNMNRGSALKKLAIRVVFIGVGLPLVGSMYTGVLNTMGDATKSGTSGSTQVVLSTYVDFQNWAIKERLNVPATAVIAWNATENKPTGESMANVRHAALEINKSTNDSWSAISSTLNVGKDQSWTEAALKDGTGDSAGGVDGYTSTISLLARYMVGTKLDAASYESAVKGDIATSNPYILGEEGQARVDKWFGAFTDAQKGLPGITDANLVANNAVVSVADGKGLTAVPAGATEGTKTYTSKGIYCSTWVGNARGEALNCNMSTLSLYNYLNTSFGSDSMTVYSSVKATSGATREMHNSVTQVGTGAMSFIYWMNAVILLGSFVIIGFGYSLSMLFSNIKRSFQMVTAIPFATIGALPGIAKVIIYATAMIMEVILTLFIYRFIQVFLISIPQIVEIPFSAILNGASGAALGGAANIMSGGTLPMVMTLLSILALIIFTVLALRVRKTMVKSINEVVAKLVDKFMETSSTPSGGKGGLAPALAGGLASGAGMAAANKAMGGSGAAAGKKAGGGPGDGPAGVTAGGIPSQGGPDGSDAGPAGSLTVGGGAGMDVSGSVDGAGPDGSGDGGSGGPVPGSPGMLPAGSSDQAVAKDVQAQGGLSEPGSSGSGDLTDSMAGSVDKTQSQYAAKDKAVADSAVAGGKAVAKGAEAAGRGMAGDAAGAAAAGMAAAGHAKDVQGNAEKAKGIQKSIDAPAPPARTGGSARGTSATASAPNGSGAGRPTGTAPRAGSAAPKQAPRPAQTPNKAPSASPNKAPSAAPKPAPKQLPKQAPAAAPKPAARQVTPSAPKPPKPPQTTAPKQAPAPNPKGGAPRPGSGPRVAPTPTPKPRQNTSDPDVRG